MDWSAIAIRGRRRRPERARNIRRWRCTRFSSSRKKAPSPRNACASCWAATSSEAALDRALDELWAKLRITRVDYKPDEGVFWDVLFRWSPDAVQEGMQVSVAESLTALVSKYLDCVLAAQQEEVEQFFSHLIGRARVREAINALQAARELSFVHVGGRVMLQVSSLQEQLPHEFTARAEVRTAASATRHAAGATASNEGPRHPPNQNHPARELAANERAAKTGHRD